MIARQQPLLVLAENGDAELLIAAEQKTPHLSCLGTSCGSPRPVVRLITMVHDIDQALWTTNAPLASLLALRRPKSVARSKTLMTGTGGGLWHFSNARTFPALEAPADRIEMLARCAAVVPP